MVSLQTATMSLGFAIKINFTINTHWYRGWSAKHHCTV